MINWVISTLGLESDSSSDMEYLECINDLIENKTVKSMRDYTQHNDIDCLEHSLYVSYSSYLICKRLKMDYRSAARGGILHDFFLYDWHIKRTVKGVHGFRHPQIALQNAKEHFELNKREQDVIAKHMWPLTIKLPRYRESWIIVAMDKYCAVIETLDFAKRNKMRKLHRLMSY